MENLSKKAPYRSGHYGGAKSVYDDVFAAPPRFGVPSLSPRIEDYAEIFGGLRGSHRVATSIPMLDLSPADVAEAAVSFQGSHFDYLEVFGGSEGSEFVVYEELVERSKGGAYDSSDEAWTPAQSETMSDESEPFACSDTYQTNAEFHYSSDVITQFKVSYNKVFHTSDDDVANGVSRVTQLNEVPGYSFLVNETRPQQKMVVTNNLKHEDFSGELTEGKQFKKFTSLPSKPFVTVSDISLKTRPSHLPPPSRPPPSLGSKDGDSDTQSSKMKASRSFVFGDATSDDDSPLFYDVEVDASSSAAVSAAAMKNVMEKAQVKLKSAKHMKERSKQALIRGETSERDFGGGKGFVENGRKHGKGLEESSFKNGGNAEWKQDEEYFEVVETEDSRNLFDVRDDQRFVEHNLQNNELRREKRESRAISHEDVVNRKMKSESEIHEKIIVEAVRGEDFENMAKVWEKESEDENKYENDFDIEENGMRLRGDAEREMYDKRLKEATERAIIEKRLKETLEREEREKIEREAREREEKEKREIEARERALEEKRLREAIEKEEKEKRLRLALEEKEKKQREAWEKEEKEKREKVARERELEEKRLREAIEKEQKEKRLRLALEEEEKKQRAAREREEKEKKEKEVRERELEEKRLGEAIEKEENQKRVRLALEEKEKKQREVRESEEKEAKEKEACEREEKEERDKEARERETEKKRLKKVLEEKEKKQKEAREREEREKREKEDREREIQEKRLREALEQEEKEKKLKIALEKEKNEKRLKLARERDEAEKWLKVSEEPNITLQKGEPKEKNCELKEDAQHAQQIREREDNEKRSKKALGFEHQDIDKMWEESNGLDENVAFYEAAKFKDALPMHDTVFEFEKIPSRRNANFAKPNIVDSGEIGANREKFQVAKDKRDEKFTSSQEVKVKVQSHNTERKGKNPDDVLFREERERKESISREREMENERLRKIEEERERERERQKDRMAVDKASLERAAVERATVDAKQRALAEARERLEKLNADAVRLRAERAVVERATAEARERAFQKAKAENVTFETRERAERMRQTTLQSDSFQGAGYNNGSMNAYSSVHGGVEVESAQRCKARLERHQRTAQRAAKALEEKNKRDLLAQRELAERNRLAEGLDAEVKRWSSGKEGNLRALLSTLQYILGPDSGWQPIHLTEVITSAAVKRAYRKATLCVHPDKLQQRGASIHQKYICEKVFDLLKAAWNKFNSEER